VKNQLYLQFPTSAVARGMVLLVSQPTSRTSRHAPIVRKTCICQPVMSRCVKRNATKVCRVEMSGFRQPLSIAQSARTRSITALPATPQTMSIPSAPQGTRPKPIRTLTTTPRTLSRQSISTKKVDSGLCTKAKITQSASSEAVLDLGYLHRKDVSAMPLSFCAVSQTDLTIPCRLLCYGDSLTVGFFDGGRSFEPYGRTLATTLSDLGMPSEVQVCGLSGLTAQEMLTKAHKDLICGGAGCRGKGLRRILSDDERFDAVLIMAGTNDLGYGYRAESVFEYVRSLHGICHASNIPTIALAPPSAKKVPLTWEHERQKLRSLLMEWASASPWVLWAADANQIVPNNGGDRTRVAFRDPDGLHLSAAGSQQLGKVLARSIKAITSTGHSTFTV